MKKLAFFLYHVLQRFAEQAGRRGDEGFAQRCREEAGRLRQDLEEHAWDGEWYRRAFFDDGTPLGSTANDENPKSRRACAPRGWP